MTITRSLHQASATSRTGPCYTSQRDGFTASTYAGPGERGPTPTRTAKILIVDDDAGIRDLLREVLLDNGYVVELAENGADALAAVRAGPPAVVLMDLMMPILSGFEATTALKQDRATAAIPIVAMSAGRTLQSLGSAIAVDDYIGKPYDLVRLLAILERHVIWPEPI